MRLEFCYVWADSQPNFLILKIFFPILYKYYTVIKENLDDNVKQSLKYL